MIKSVLPGAGESDGTVAVEETRLPKGMTDFVTVDATHTNIMKDPRVGQLVVNFLRNGKFATSLSDLQPITL